MFARTFARPEQYLAIAVAAVALSSCRRHTTQTNDAPTESPAPPPVPRPETVVVVAPIYDAGLKPDWKDWGWAPHADVAGAEARIDMSDWKGWQLVHPDPLPGKFGGVAFRFKPPPGYGDFLSVHLEGSAGKLAAINVVAAHVKTLPDGWLDAFVSMQELDPDDLPFDKVVFFVSKNVPKGWVAFDKIGLTKAPDPTTLPKPPTRDVAMRVDCAATPTPISPMIYGIALDPIHDAKDHQQWEMGATARRWGGNPSSRYNWQLGNAWNSASDWYFENLNFTGDPKYSYGVFLKDNRDHGIASALTIPILGWVAKDLTSVGFPRATFPDQASFDPYRAEAGNGMKGDKPIHPGLPSTTSVPADAAFIKKWIEAIVAEDKKNGRRSVQQYILDNEPNLWSSTHRDVHPEPVTYDELLDKTIAIGTAIREADPDATIAGPAEWGWTNYFYSGEDMKSGSTLHLDRRAHGDKPLIEWYLGKLAEHEKKTGTRILDVLDLHFYPQGDKVYSTESNRNVASLRVRSTRGLWDPTYTDESWIKDTVKLLPRMKEWVASNYPGRGISIGEWSFGGEYHWSGGIATAEALGRFGQNGVTWAFYWTYPPENSPTFWAFRAFRNFDGKGAKFESLSLPATAPPGTSIFASRDDAKKRTVLVVLNQSPDSGVRATIDAAACAPKATRRLFVFTGQPSGFAPPVDLGAEGSLVAELPPHSIGVIEMTAKD